MICPKCGIDNIPGNRFCGNCGAPLPAAGTQDASGAATQQADRSAQTGAAGKKHPEIPAEYKPISAWGYFGYNLLFVIPIVGTIFLIVYALGGTGNKNLKNFARSQFIWLIIVIIIAVITGILYLIGAKYQ